MPEEGNGSDPLARFLGRTRRRGVNTALYWVVRAVMQPGDHALVQAVPDGPAEHPRRVRDPRREPPQLPRPRRDRLLPETPDLLRCEEGALREPASGLAPQLPLAPCRCAEASPTRTSCAPRSSCSTAGRQ